MGKLFRSKDILLLGLANLLDVFEEARDPFHLMSASYENMYGWIPEQYKRHNFYQLVSRSYKAKFIEKVEKNGKIYIRITSEGQRIIQRDFPMLSLQNRRWDGRWRIVMFDIEEVNRQIRERLRIKLKELGFGMLQESVFISPHDLLKDFSEFAESSGIRDYLYLLETHKLIVGDEKEFANKIWKLQELNEKYKEIIDEIEEIKNRHLVFDSGRIKKSDVHVRMKEGMKEKEKVKEGVREKIRQIRNNWLEIVVRDPFLPKAFLSQPWYGDEAEKLVRGL
jgi:phenylacetic acid degradation operon negative regulatory protein